MRIEACFDSHVHWAATGEFARRLQLSGVSAPDNLNRLEPRPHHHRGDWLLGFGYDANEALEWTTPRVWLDRWRPHQPIMFTARDGHQRWLSTEALRRAGLLERNSVVPEGGFIARDESGEPTGLIGDRTCDLVDRVLPPVPGLTVRGDLLAGVQTFNDAGFTHIRDLTCDEEQWNEALRIDQSGLLTLAVEEYFWVRAIDDADHIIELARRARREHSPNVRARGIKLFFDGSLSGNGAHLSCEYHGGGRGLVLWSDADLGEVIRRAWTSDLDVAVHAIGDEAAERVVSVALNVQTSGVRGALHLEHAQVVRLETLLKMQNLNVFCHLQPAHWLADRAWLDHKLGPLARYSFPWRRLQEYNVPISFGSDSPVEPPSVARTIRALTESAASGIPRLLGRAESVMGHRDAAWAPNSFTVFENFEPRQVVFRGEHLI